MLYPSLERFNMVFFSTIRSSFVAIIKTIIFTVSTTNIHPVNNLTVVSSSKISTDKGLSVYIILEE